MADFQNILDSITSSPESMEKIMDMVKLFAPSEKESAPEQATPPEPPSPLGGIDPAIISSITEMLSEYNADGDRRINLLYALRPYLSGADAEHIDKAVRIVKLSRVAKSLFGKYFG